MIFEFKYDSKCIISYFMVNCAAGDFLKILYFYMLFTYTFRREAPSENFHFSI